MKNSVRAICTLVAGIMIGGASIIFANQAIQAIQNTEIKISLNGQVQNFTDETTGERQYPITYNNRTYLPLRNVANLAGLVVDYDANSNTAILTSDNYISNEQWSIYAKAYCKATNGYLPKFVDVTDGPEPDTVIIHLFDIVDEHTATKDWYTIDRYTGKGTNVLNEDIDISWQNTIKILSTDTSSTEELSYINLNGFDINKLREWFDTESYEVDKEYAIGYTTLGKNKITYKIFYKKTYKNNMLFEYIILRNESNELEICMHAEEYMQYAEKIFTLEDEDVLGIATFDEIGNTNQNIFFYNSHLKPIKDDRGRINDYPYEDWGVELGYEHQYGFNISDGGLEIYRNVENKKVTYLVYFVDLPEEGLYKHTFGISEVYETTEGFKLGAGSV